MIIILGATGTIGQKLVAQLAARNQAFIIVARNDNARIQFPQHTVRYGDLDKPESLIKAFNGGSALFLLSSHGEKMEAQQRSAIDAAKAVGIGRIVKISGSEASIDPHSMSETGREHWRIEQYLKQQFNDYVILRCNFFMQNLLDQVATMVRNNKTIMLPFDKNTGFSFIDADDIAACTAEVLTQPHYLGETLYLTGEPSSFLALSQSLSLHLKQSINYKRIPLWLAHVVMRGKGMPSHLVRHQLEMAKLFMQGAGAKNTDNVKNLLGRAPINLDEFVERNQANFH